MSFHLASAALTKIGPISSTGALRAVGVTSREISRACSSGEIIRVRRGVYASAHATAPMIHAAQHGGAIACATAARMHGLWVIEQDEDLHVWQGHAGNPRSCPRDDCAPVMHWDEGTAVVGKLPPVRNVLLQLAVCRGEEAFFTGLESALRQCLVTAPDLHWLSRRLPARLRWLLSFARTDADSGLESLIRLRLHRLGIAVRTQVRIAGVGEVDFVIDDWLIIEADGKANHDDLEGARRSLRHKDLQRDAKAAARGYETLRFDYAMIIHHWEVVVAAILGRLAAHRAASGV